MTAVFLILYFLYQISPQFERGYWSQQVAMFSTRSACRALRPKKRRKEVMIRSRKENNLLGSQIEYGMLSEEKNNGTVILDASKTRTDDIGKLDFTSKQCDYSDTRDEWVNSFRQKLTGVGSPQQNDSHFMKEKNPNTMDNSDRTGAMVVNCDTKNNTTKFERLSSPIPWDVKTPDCSFERETSKISEHFLFQGKTPLSINRTILVYDTPGVS